MPRYVALLRAVNVGGRSIVKMADLRDLLESFGLKDVETYIQTGNVVFTSSKRGAKAVADDLQARLETADIKTTVFVRTPQQLAAAATRNPFRPTDGSVQSHIVFLDAKPDARSTKLLMEMEGEEYSFRVDGDVLYYAYDKKWAGKRRTIDFEKVLGVRGTARTWKVVDKLVDMAGPETSR